MEDWRKRGREREKVRKCEREGAGKAESAILIFLKYFLGSQSLWQIALFFYFHQISISVP